ncbi:hypothetical protein HZS_3306, partial [Henneguya salminicola]
MKRFGRKNENKKTQKVEIGINDGSFVQSKFYSTRKDKIPKFKSPSNELSEITTTEFKKNSADSLMGVEIFFDRISLGTLLNCIYSPLFWRIMSFNFISPKKSKYKDENLNPKKTLELDKLNNKNLSQSELMENSKINVNSVQYQTKNKKKYNTLLDLKEGDKVLAKCSDRSFRRATLIKKNSANFLVKLKDGSTVNMEGTKLRLLSQPKKSLKKDKKIASKSFNTSYRTRSRGKNESLFKLNDKEMTSISFSSPLKHRAIRCQDKNSIEKPNIVEPDKNNVKNIIKYFDNLQNNGAINEDKTEINIAENISCACGSNEIQSHMVQCVECQKFQHGFCLEIVQEPHTCFLCTKSTLKIDDMFYYNFYMMQNGMFPDSTLNKLCAITHEHASIIRLVNKCIKKIENKLPIDEDVK